MTILRGRLKAVLGTLTVLALAAPLAACSTDKGGSAETRKMEFAHYQVSGPSVQGELRLIEELKAQSGGALKVNMHWSEELGTVTEIPGLIKTGAVQMGAANVHAVPDQFPANSLVTVPVPPSNREDSMALQKRFYKEVLFKDPMLGEFAAQNMKPLLAQPLFPLWGISKKPMCGLDLMKGKRIRAVGSYFPKLIEAVGAVPVEIAAGDIYQSLDRGTVDMVVTPLGLMDSFKLYESGKYVCGPIMMSLGGHIVTMNTDFLKSMPKSEQDLVGRVAEESQAWAFEDAYRTDAEVQQKLEKAGLKFTTLPAEEVKKWFAMGPDFIAAWAEKARKAGVKDVDSVVTNTRAIFGG